VVLIIPVAASPQNNVNMGMQSMQLHYYVASSIQSTYLLKLMSYISNLLNAMEEAKERFDWFQS